MKSIAIASFLAAACGLLLLKTKDSNQESLQKNKYDSSPPQSFRSLLEERTQKYNADNDPKVLNVHVVPHTHDDVGWLKTVEEYYYGRNMSIQAACVENILDSTVQALLDNPDRTFVYIEMKFFSMWWNQQSDAMKDTVRQLVAKKQWTFANGGWCMHDEAATHFMGMIDQTTLGHDFLKRELGVTPKVGWQLDPFGHSATQASLLTKGVGFDALYFGRIDHQDLDLRHQTQECEGLWASSRAINTSAFWGLTGSYSGNYGPPRGFCFSTFCHDEYLINMNRTGLIEQIKMLVQELKVQSDRTKGNHIMLTMGEDFNYQQASKIFANLDVMIGSLHNFQLWNLIDVSSMMGPRFERINIFYSSPEYCTQCKHQQTKRTESTTPGVEWSTKKDDFFPYSDFPHSFWTGYFTSRSAFKRFERVSSGFLMAARQIEALPEPNNATSPPAIDQPLFALEDASAVVQHHDAVTGTAKQHVANDYSKRLQAGIDQAAAFVEQKLVRVLTGNNNTAALSNLKYCQLLNETICEASQEASRDSSLDIYVVVYNAVASNKSTIIRLPADAMGTFVVTRLDNATAATTREAQSVRARATPFVASQSADSKAARFEIMFDTGPLEPVGATVFRIQHTSQTGSMDQQNNPSFVEKQRALQYSEKDLLEAVVADNGIFKAEFARATGELLSISTPEVHLNISQLWGFYTSYDSSLDNSTDGLFDDQNSSAYIFRPASNTAMKTIPYSKGAAYIKAPLGVEVLSRFEEPWIRQVTRVLKGLPYLEVEYKIGPIPIEDGRGKEIITRLSSTIQSNGTFYTDSNGREFQKRIRNFRPTYDLDLHEPVAGNYYPVNAAIYLEDASASMCVLVDRSQGGSSLADGSMELMPQRRTLTDDHRGVNEPLNETDGGVTPYPPYGDAHRWGNGVVIHGTYRIMIGKGMSGASVSRSQMDESFAPPLVFVASAPSGTGLPLARPSFSALQRDALPPNVMCVTFKKLDSNAENQYMIRLGHQYSINEDKALSQPAQIDLSQLIAGMKLVSVVETTLTGNEEYNSWAVSRLDWTGSDLRSQSTVSDTNTTVVLQPMEVKTFVVTLEQQP